MRIDHNIKVAKKVTEVKWLKHYHCGVGFKNLYKKDGRGGFKPSSYHTLFIHFMNLDMGEGVSGKALRQMCNWREGTHSDYFSLFTMNKVFTYDKSKKVYVKGENYDAYLSMAKEQYKELGCN